MSKDILENSNPHIEEIVKNVQVKKPLHHLTNKRNALL